MFQGWLEGTSKQSHTWCIFVRQGARTGFLRFWEEAEFPAASAQEFGLARWSGKCRPGSHQATKQRNEELVLQADADGWPALKGLSGQDTLNWMATSEGIPWMQSHIGYTHTHHLGKRGCEPAASLGSFTHREDRELQTALGKNS